ncbi:rhamnogalacturonan acetylesterase [Sutcliffiella deserti]|uniref:rhamnogalacturonan acetylesterase n=1 Tax=Sutcliffiella deserti TaxID=2875501 RepID=UPI00295AB383|nr:rhamnogalacturonan acetylesterase [Sutcliffiella deserti]
MDCLKKCKVFLAGDSTMSEYSESVAPRTGWGQVLGKYLPPSIQVINKATSGRSSKSFIDEGRLEEISTDIEQGDYLLIQFGHNDQKEDELRRTLPFSTYQSYLLEYLEVAFRKGATPILITPVQRRSFDDQGEFYDTHGEYPQAMRELASEKNVVLVDLSTLSKDLFTLLGSEKTKSLFLWLSPKEHPNYPDGVDDNTHFSSYGAKKVAELVAPALQSIIGIGKMKE